MTIDQINPRYYELAAREALPSHRGARYWTERLRRAEAEFAGMPIPPPFPSVAPAGDRIRLGLLCPCLGPGGAEAWQLTLARSLDPSRFAWMGCAVAALGAPIDPAMRAAHEAIMPVSGEPGAAKALARKCDILIGWIGQGLPSILAGISPAPAVVMACHASADSGWGATAYEDHEGITAIVGVSELAREAVPETTRAKVRVEIIWNAVDAVRLEIRRDKASMRAAWGVPIDAPVAGFLGRLSPEKRPDLMIDAARHLPEPWHVVIVGSGHERERLDVSGLGRVRLIDADLAAGDVLAAFDALVVPSAYESFGLALAEGLAVGVPVVSTPVGLARLEPGLTRTVPQGADGREIAGAILADLADVEGTRGRVERARRFARERLSPDRFGREWGEMLASLVPSKAGPRPRPSVDPSVRDKVNACPDRGAILSVSLQPEGCRCGELSECRAGRGKEPGKVTLRDCLDCQAAR